MRTLHSRLRSPNRVNPQTFEIEIRKDIVTASAITKTSASLFANHVRPVKIRSKLFETVKA